MNVGERYRKRIKNERKGTMSYNPSVGRWMQEDPDGYVDGPNTYQFEESNPVNRLDPSGENAQSQLNLGTDPVGILLSGSNKGASVFPGRTDDGSSYMGTGWFQNPEDGNAWEQAPNDDIGVLANKQPPSEPDRDDERQQLKDLLKKFGPQKGDCVANQNALATYLNNNTNLKHWKLVKVEGQARWSVSPLNRLIGQGYHNVVVAVPTDPGMGDAFILDSWETPTYMPLSQWMEFYGPSSDPYQANNYNNLAKEIGIQ